MSIKADLAPLHPGEVLLELYLTPLGMSAGKLAKALHVPRTRIERIVKGQIGITTETALRLAKYFNSTPELWLNMQTAWDLAQARESIGSGLNIIEPIGYEAEG